MYRKQRCRPYFILALQGLEYWDILASILSVFVSGVPRVPRQYTWAVRDNPSLERELMSEFLTSILTPLNNFVWGPVMLVMLVGTGLYLNIGLKFYPFRNWKNAYKCLWQGRKHQSSEGEISPWNALMTAIAADIGTGNIVGVATAIAIGGPGALFWMWMTALVGMMTKFCEVMLSVKYREQTPAGNWVGGAMYFIKNGLGPRWKWLATAFAIFGITAALMGVGGMVQANAIAVNVNSTFGVSKWIVAAVLLATCLMVLVGGVKRVGIVSGKLVPFMAVFYVCLCLTIIFMHIEKLPSIFWWVVTDAFTPTAAQGGFAGATIMMAIRMGVARGVFSNEAGLGTAPMAHAASTAESPLVQASIGMLDVFIDTLIVCSMTGFVILISTVTPESAAIIGNAKVQAGDPLWSSGVNGGLLSAMAFSSNLGTFGEVGVTISLTLFAFTTSLGWSVYGERCAIYLFGDKAQTPFRILFSVVMASGAVITLDLVWLIADTANALMAFPNLIGILLLSPMLFKYVREEVAKDNRFKI